MNILDYILLGFILMTALLGLRKGFLLSLGSIVGIVAGAVLASRFYPLLAGFFGNTNTANLVSFILVFGVIIKVVGLLFWLLGKIFQIVTVLPFIATFDRLLGLILGTVKAIFICAVVLNIALKFPINYWMMEQMTGSIITKVLLNISQIFLPLFPEALKKLKSFL
ncbi:MAG: CvpA family protein [Patescibacteria group bacterium]